MDNIRSILLVKNIFIFQMTLYYFQSYWLNIIIQSINNTESRCFLCFYVAYCLLEAFRTKNIKSLTNGNKRLINCE